jgi:hypothetical protein
VPKDIRELIKESLDTIKLNISIFGPQVDPPSTDERTCNLQLKRAQIRDKLTGLGHNARYAGELVDPSLGNVLLQEELIMREYDLIITLVGSPGSIIETGFIARNPYLAQKAQLFMDAAHTGGLVAEACRLAEAMGAFFKEYEYPKDLVDCHLLGFALARVAAVQTMRYLI